MKTVPVRLGQRSYDIHIDSGLLSRVGPLTRDAAGGATAYVVTDSNVGPIYADAVTGSLRESGYAVAVVTFPAGEPNKVLATVSDLFDQIFAAPTPPDRDSVIVALGGGVTGDIAGFIAATLLRGVPFVQVPTSLLADVDSSVGGKTGVDHPTGKNLIGAFHQPRGVFIDTDALRTLAPVELASGLGECVKHAVIRDVGMLDWIERNASAITGGDGAVGGELIARNVAIKAAVVADDERESGVRAHLNFGHTIGHAIEAVAGFEADETSQDYLRHGHCVGLGMVAANHVAAGRGLLTPAEVARVEALLEKLALPTRLAGLDGAALLEIMRRDKKCRGGTIRFVLPAGKLGCADVYDDVSEAEIFAAVEYLGRK